MGLIARLARDRSSHLCGEEIDRTPGKRMVEAQRLITAYRKAQADLLAQRGNDAHWTGELSSSPLSTATAISALVLAEQHAHTLGEEYLSEQLYQRDLSELLVDSVHWLAEHQNEDGGWGDTDKSTSNIATTMLVRAAFHLTGVPARYADLLQRADAYIAAQGGIPGLRRRYGRDKTFAVPILANCALAELVPWKKVPQLPFELACFPQSFYRYLNLPVVSYAIPALVAIGQARYHHLKPRNPITRMLRKMAWEPSYRVLEKMQPESGGYLEATPLTSFVVMSLASSGHADSKVVRRGVSFLLASVRSDGSWPIDTNLSTWNTSLSINALAAAGDLEAVETSPAQESACLDWLLSCQHKEVHPFTGAAPGGWAWTDLSGGVPDADDTPGALLALAHRRDSATPEQQQQIDEAAQMGVEWLLNLQNSDGGWPTFCRGWGKLPFDRSGADLTAHALRALHTWRHRLPKAATTSQTTESTESTDGEQLPPRDVLIRDQSPSAAMMKHSPAAAAQPPEGQTGGECVAVPSPLARAVGRFRRQPATPPEPVDARIERAIRTGLRYLFKNQRPDGSWVPLWFGNQFLPSEENPIYGTSKVLLALRDLGYANTAPAKQAVAWLASVQQADGGWGGGPLAREKGLPQQSSTVEETAVALEGLLTRGQDKSLQVTIEQGLAWLADAVERERHRESSPIGFYFAKLWYHERLYPYIYAVSALGTALAHRHASAVPTSGQAAHLSGT